MKLLARLPKDRYDAGTLVVLGGDADQDVVAGPFRCRGEADNSGAKAHGNVLEDPTRSYGDHPAGTYRVASVVREPQPPRTYGPVFIALAPVAGEAWQARENGRKGFGIHGGAPHADGRLRETFGCLRIDDAAAIALADLLEAERAAGREVFYVCEVA